MCVYRSRFLLEETSSPNEQDTDSTDTSLESHRSIEWHLQTIWFLKLDSTQSVSNRSQYSQKLIENNIQMECILITDT